MNTFPWAYFGVCNQTWRSHYTFSNKYPFHYIHTVCSAMNNNINITFSSMLELTNIFRYIILFNFHQSNVRCQDRYYDTHILQRRSDSQLIMIKIILFFFFWWNLLRFTLNFQLFNIINYSCHAMKKSYNYLWWWILTRIIIVIISQYTNIKSLYHTPETYNIMLCVNYTSIKINLKILFYIYISMTAQWELTSFIRGEYLISLVVAIKLYISIIYEICSYCTFLSILSNHFHFTVVVCI